MAATNVRPAARKQRRTTARTSWFYDPYSEEDGQPLWRFHPTDLAHRAVYPPDMDENGDPIGQEKRPWERKGWIPADQALQTIDNARRSLKSAPEPVKQLAVRLGVSDEKEDG